MFQMIRERFQRIAPKLDRAQSYALTLFNMWWRPVSCWSIAIAIFVSGVFLPLKNGNPADLTALAALVASLTPFVAARCIEKIRPGVDENV